MLRAVERYVVFFCCVAAAAILLTLAPSLAGTTGSITGTVARAGGAPIAGARVVATSPSQTATTTSDDGGRFAFLSLAPDTYTITISKQDYDTSTTTGITVFADQLQTLHLALNPSLHTIAHVTARSSMDVVKSGTTTDVYSVNSAVTAAAAGIGGGGNLNNAYSAIAAVPGAFVPPNQQGWDQTVYIRGGNYDQVGYEFDGVPVNRSFDNYPGSTAGTLGQQELQVYTGGGTAGESASGLAGFINQVIKTGTYPGYASVSAGLGTPTYYHNLQVEVGGATPDRNFSYYVGIGGYNQDFRYLDQFNGSNLGDVWGYSSIGENTISLPFGGVFPYCSYAPPSGSAYSDWYDGPNGSPVYNPFGYASHPSMLPPHSKNPGCYATISPAYASYSNLADRENVVNLHFGIPHRNDSGRDDVQFLYNVTALDSQFYSSMNDLGPHVINQLSQVIYQQNVPFSQTVPEVWGDFITWPSNTYFGESPSRVSPVAYYEPGSPGNRCANVDPYGFYGGFSVPGQCAAGTWSAVPDDSRDGFWNDASIVKLQYQHNMGSNAYFRIYGYSFYSDWLQTSPLSWGTPFYGFGVTSYDYELESHTRGLAFSFADQLSPAHLFTVDANYTTASTNRYNNTNFNNTPYTSVSNLTNGKGQCIAYYGGSYLGENYSEGQPAPCNSPLTSGTFAAPEPVSAPAGTAWQITYTGNSGFLNNVTPDFTSVALEDQWNPSDKWNFDFGLRGEDYAYDLANTTSNGQEFWFLAGQREFCYNPDTLAPYFIPSKPASGRPPTPFVGFNCPIDYSIPAHPVQTVHPDGKDGHLLLSDSYPPSISDYAITPRVGGTYTLNADTVLRFSAGRYAQEPETYQVQYNARDNNLAYDLFQAFWQYGFTTPEHNPQVQYSDNYDASYEHRFKGTDMSIKVTPYYRYATNQIYDVALPFGLTGGLNSGVERVDGFETEFTKGDFSKNGLALLVSYTYTNAAERWANFPGTTINPIDPYNQDIANFNGLTRAGGGAKCYQNNGINYVADPNCTRLKAAPFYAPILNPYYNMSPEPLLDRNGWYPVGLDYGYLSPSVLSTIVNYKLNKLSVTPAVTFNEGQPYGNPADVMGLDPRTCDRDSSHIPSAPNAHQANYTRCGLAATQNGTEVGVLYIPDPATGQFDSFGAFRQPSQLNLSLQIGYQVTPNIKINALLANLINSCFGGSKEPWSALFPPNGYTCGYISNYYYVSNFYNGSSPNDRAANGNVALNQEFATEYIPAYADTNSYVLPNPFNMYISASIRL